MTKEMSKEKVIRMFIKEIECLSHDKCKDCPLEKVCDPIQTPHDDEYIEAYKVAIKALEQEPKTGHWELDEADNSLVCDKCGCRIWANDIFRGEAHYCPNCGSYNGGEE